MAKGCIIRPQRQANNVQFTHE